MSKHTYKILPPEQWDRLLDLTDLIEGRSIPPPEMSRAIVAENEEGKITGVLFLQFILHAEPLICRPGVNWMKLKVLADEILTETPFQRYVISTSDSKVEQMARLAGFQDTGITKVWEQVLPENGG